MSSPSSMRDTGVPRNSPTVQPLVPLHQIIATSSRNNAIPGQPGGYLDLSSIQKVTGTNRAGMFVSTAVTGEGSHHSQQQQRHHNQIHNNQNSSSSSPQSFASSESRKKGGHGSGRQLTKEEKYEIQKQMLSERSPQVTTSVDVREQPDLQMRFAASVMPSGRRSVQPLPDFLDSSYGFRVHLAGPSSPVPPPPLPATSSPVSQYQEENNNFLSTGGAAAATNNYFSSPLPNYNNAGNLSTTSSIPRIHDEEDHQERNNNNQPQNPNVYFSNSHNIATTPSPLPKIIQKSPFSNIPSATTPTPQHHSSKHQQHDQNNNNNNIRPNSVTSPRINNNVISTTPTSNQHRKSSASRHRNLHNTNNNNNNSGGKFTSSARNHASNNASSRTGKASRVLCCPEEHATVGHLANGIVIGTCEKQAMERYLQISRELELEQEARATDKWKAELELVKSLNRIQELDKRVEKLTEIVENPRPLQEAKMLREEFEARWKAAQLRLDEVEDEKSRWRREEEQLRLKLMQKEHECEGLAAAVKRMEKADAEHEQLIAQWRKKWFEERGEKEKAESAIRDLQKEIGKISYENKSLRAAIRGLENRLIVNSRKGNGGKSPIPSNNNNNKNSDDLFCCSPSQGAARNAVSSLNTSASTSGAKVQFADLDAAVRVLMHAYTSPGQSPLRAMRNNLSNTRRSSPSPSSRGNRNENNNNNNSGILVYMSAKGEETNTSRNNSSEPKPSGIDNLMIRTSSTK